MLKIIDCTLANLDQFDLTKENIHTFLEYMKDIGIVDLEISTKIYDELKVLPEGYRFYLHLGPFDKACSYRGIYKYIIPHCNQENCISSFQINDVKEIALLRQYSDYSYVKITGLDDLMCGNYSFVLQEIKNIFQNSEIIFCPENTYHCASALCVLWLESGGKAVTTSFLGIGGFGATEEVYIALRVVNRYKPNQSLKGFQNLKDWYENIAGEPISPIKPIIGKRIFHVESGIHVDGIMKNPANYEAYEPQLVGKETKIVIGKHSGSNSIKIKCKEHGIILQDAAVINLILQKVKNVCMGLRRGLTDAEFLQLVREVLDNEGKEMDR